MGRKPTKKQLKEELFNRPSMRRRLAAKAKDNKKAVGHKALADVALAFQRDFYLCTEKEMVQRWGSSLSILEHVKPALSAEMNAAISANFKEHNPFWEYTREFIYNQEEFDPNTQEKIGMAEFRLYEPLHKDIVCKEILKYVIEGDSAHVGLAVFISRYCLKTYIGCISLASFLLTRHRVLFNDYTTIRIIHDVIDEAVVRSKLIKNKHQYCKPLIELYPEVEIPHNWGTEKKWDFRGRDVEEGVDIDAQISATSSGSAQQGRHPMYTIVDDLESERHTNSPAAVKETLNFFSGFKFSQQIGLSRKVLLGTFYNPDSIHANIVEKAEAAKRGEIPEGATWRIIHLPGILDEDGEKKALYPTRLNLEELERLRQEDIAENGTDLGWRMQCMLDFKASGEHRFDMEMFREVNLLEPESALERKVSDSLYKAPTFVFFDAAGKDESTAGKGDSNAIWVVKFPRIDEQIHLVAIDAHSDNISSLTDASMKCLELANQYDAWWIIAEESPSHKVVGSELNRVAKERGYRYHFKIDGKSSQSGNIRTLTPKKGAASGVANISGWKMGRITKLKNRFNNGLVWFNSAIPNLGVLRSQMGPFPFIRNDDELDALSLGEDERIASLVPVPRIRNVPFKKPPTPPPPKRLSRYTPFYGRG